MAEKCLALHLYVDRRDDLKAKEVISNGRPLFLFITIHL